MKRATRLHVATVAACFLRPAPSGRLVAGVNHKAISDCAWHRLPRLFLAEWCSELRTGLERIGAPQGSSKNILEIYNHSPVMLIFMEDNIAGIEEFLTTPVFVNPSNGLRERYGE